MEHTLISTIIVSIVTTFIFGLVAKKLKLPAIFGYLLAGVALGPYTPGFVADLSLARQLAEIGVILLMFGVGLHFSVKDLMDVRKVALPGAVVQMVSATIVGLIVAYMMGYSVVHGIVFGFSLSVASTIVLLRTLEQRHLLDSKGGKIAIGWLVVEDIVMVFALVILPVIAEMRFADLPLDYDNIVATFLTVTFKIGGFFAFMLIVGRRFLPWLLTIVARFRSHELNALCTLSIALGFAGIAYVVFDASLALGAFLSGMVLSESEIGRRSAKNTLAMRDTFSVLFFLSVGMLFDPSTLIKQPLGVALTLVIVIIAKSIAALAIMHWFKQTKEASFIVALGLAQIGEFSFILCGLALVNNMFTQELYNLILAGAMISIVINPFLFHFYDFIHKKKISF
jgi:CPA2 family monovalent cation:H+ antiporter-2